MSLRGAAPWCDVTSGSGTPAQLFPPVRGNRARGRAEGQSRGCLGAEGRVRRPGVGEGSGPPPSKRIRLRSPDSAGLAARRGRTRARLSPRRRTGWRLLGRDAAGAGTPPPPLAGPGLRSPRRAGGAGAGPEGSRPALDRRGPRACVPPPCCHPPQVAPEHPPGQQTQAPLKNATRPPLAWRPWRVEVPRCARRPPWQPGPQVAGVKDQPRGARDSPSPAQ